MQELVHFLFEAGYLKNVDRSGWWLLGNKDPESVAEHSFRCTILAQVRQTDLKKQVYFD
jgi:putative hydrolase of HD superfamily